MFKVDVIMTGSSGNSVMIDDCILIDFGSSYKQLGKYMEKADVVIATHKHTDHFRIQSLRMFNNKRSWKVRNAFYTNQTVADIIEEHHDDKFNFTVKPSNILKTHTLKDSEPYRYDLRTKKGNYTLETFRLEHNTENQGLIITNENGDTLLYATDTNTMEYAPNRIYDYLLIEGNYDFDVWAESLENLDTSVSKTIRQFFNLHHLSLQDFENFVRNHSHEDSKVWQLHQSSEYGAKTKAFKIENP